MDLWISGGRGASMVNRLTSTEAVATLPGVIIGLLRHQLTAKVSRVGTVKVAIISGTRFQMTLHIDDWNLLMDNILYDPETISDGEDEVGGPAVPSSSMPYRLGTYLKPKSATRVQHRFNPRTPINLRLITYDPDAFRSKIQTELTRIFV